MSVIPTGFRRIKLGNSVGMTDMVARDFNPL
jgi:hypothetical protein